MTSDARKAAPLTAPLVKICGLTREQDATHAQSSGAGYLGAILAGGPRLLSPDRARSVLGPRRHGVKRVVVFGDQSADEVVVLGQELDLDVLQLHGTHTVDVVREIADRSGREVWPVLRVAGTTVPVHAAALAGVSGALVLDAHVVGQLGGTGVSLDWAGLASSVAGLREAVPHLRLILAGGLRPENVARAIRLLSPQVVDVSSGVETAPGVKDPALVRQFVMAAHDAVETQR